MNSPIPTKEQLLQKIYGYDSFRARQSEIIEDASAGRDVLVIMPTGGGKSLTYQIPSLLRSGTGIVISPLIALMKDQVDALAEVGITAGFLNSTMTDEQQWEMEASVRRGDIQLLYIAPERLKTAGCITLLKSIEIALFAIDEAHCVSQWGHDFRPDYLQIERVLRQFPEVPRMALTATADRTTREDIINRLGLREVQKYVDSFDRPNIQYRIQARPEYVKTELLKFIRNEYPDASGIIYAGTRNMTEDYALWLQEKGIKAVAYHAGMKREERTENQDMFTRGEVDVVVATIAFGMGIDKPDIRYVVHIGLPSTIEAYYQETGRAGRDGLPSVAWMLYSMQDVIRQQGFIDRSEADESFKQIMTIKLNRLIGLCESVECRRRALLNYFDEHMADDCGNCDNCNTPPSRWDGTIAAKKALSAVYRTGQEFSSSYIIDLLLGRNTEKILANNHQELPTFACGKELKERRWRSVMRQLLTNGYLHSDPESRGRLTITEKGIRTMTEEVTVQFRRDATSLTDSSGKESAATDHQVEDTGPDSLYQKLKELRDELSRKKGVPPYIVYDNKTLSLMARAKPTNWAELATISGFGQYKVKQYGNEICRVVQKFMGTQGNSSATTSTNDSDDWQVSLPSKDKPGRVGARWSREEEKQLTQLFNDNTQIKEIARVLDRKPGAVYSRLRKLGLVEDD